MNPKERDKTRTHRAYSNCHHIRYQTITIAKHFKSNFKQLLLRLSQIQEWTDKTWDNPYCSFWPGFSISVDERNGRRLRFQMNNKLFVGNLSYGVTDTILKDLFSQFGNVTSCNVATDRDTGRSRGFGFVDMGTQQEAEGAIKGLNGMTVEGRQISVSVSQPKPKQSRRY